jgi:hypothetical protein
MPAHSSYSITDGLFWLAGAEPRLLLHAYTDRGRFISIGLSVTAATLMIATAAALAVGMGARAWLGWGLFPLVLIVAGFCLRQAFAWVWEAAPEHFGRRLAMLALVLTASAALLSWPVQRYILGPVTHQASPAAMQLLVWAIRLTVLLVLLVPVYATAVSSRCAYARTLATRHAFNSVFSN